MIESLVLASFRVAVGSSSPRENVQLAIERVGIGKRRTGFLRDDDRNWPAHWSWSTWSIDANEFAAQVVATGNLVVNATSLANVVAIDRADNDTGVAGAITMQSNEVPAVQR